MRCIKPLILCIVLSIANGSYAEQTTKRQNLDWAALKVSFENYANHPTGKNAKKVIELLPKKEHIKYNGEKNEEETINFIYDAYQLRMLERQVLAGDKEAVRLAFNLMAITDGAFAEDLDIMLGSLVRSHPKLFLEGLSEFQLLFDNVDGLIGNLGDAYVDRMKAQCYDLNLRIEALLTVKEPKLISVRDRCISSLRDHINTYCKNV